MEEDGIMEINAVYAVIQENHPFVVRKRGSRLIISQGDAPVLKEPLCLGIELFSFLRAFPGAEADML